LNQQIQVFDGFEYLAFMQAIKIVASSAGQLINCFIFGLSDAQAHGFYAEYQFDIEEYIIEQIEHERWNDNGEIHIQHTAI
jgi:hypothetical protein